jgi:hypothetical protein
MTVLLGKCIATIDELYEEVGRLHNALGAVRKVVDDYGV